MIWERARGRARKNLRCKQQLTMWWRQSPKVIFHFLSNGRKIRLWALKSHSSTMVVTELRNVLICLFVRVVLNVYYKCFVVKLDSSGNLLAISVRTSRERVFNWLARSDSNFTIKSTEFCEERFVTVWRQASNCDSVLLRFYCIAEMVCTR